MQIVIRPAVVAWCVVVKWYGAACPLPTPRTSNTPRTGSGVGVAVSVLAGLVAEAVHATRIDSSTSAVTIGYGTNAA